MRLEKILQSQGVGSRRECNYLIRKGFIRVEGEVCQDPKADFKTENLAFAVNDTELTYREQVYVALNKPQGYECSHQAQHHYSVYEQLPEHLVLRGIQTVGRLDQDTTGLLLLTDDGQFIQALTHPKKHVAKEYWVTAVDPITQTQLNMLERGVELRNEKGTYAATNILQTSEHEIQMTIHQGVYHQVKRMLAAVGNKVESLKRQKIGELELPTDLEEGEWIYLTAEQVQAAKKTLID